jgi:hypothetical protein
MPLHLLAGIEEERDWPSTSMVVDDEGPGEARA